MRRASILVLVLLGFILQVPYSGVAGTDRDKKKKEDIKIVVKSVVKRGPAPLTIQVVAQIEAAEELDQYIYESSSEWLVQGSFVLTSTYTGGNSSPRGMGQNPESSYTRMLYGQRQMVAKQRKRAPRKKYKEGMEIPRTLIFEQVLDKAGKYYISYSLRRGKYSSNIVIIDVSGDTTFDPMRDPH